MTEEEYVQHLDFCIKNNLHSLEFQRRHRHWKRRLIEMQKDTYLQSLHSTIEVCDLVLQNKGAFTQEQIQKAEQLKKETEKNIQARESIPLDKRL